MDWVVKSQKGGRGGGAMLNLRRKDRSPSNGKLDDWDVAWCKFSNFISCAGTLMDDTTIAAQCTSVGTVTQHGVGPLALGTLALEAAQRGAVV